VNSNLVYTVGQFAFGSGNGSLTAELLWVTFDSTPYNVIYYREVSLIGRHGALDDA